MCRLCQPFVVESKTRCVPPLPANLSGHKILQELCSSLADMKECLRSIPGKNGCIGSQEQIRKSNVASEDKVKGHNWRSMVLGRRDNFDQGPLGTPMTCEVLPRNTTSTAQYAAVAVKTSCFLALVKMEHEAEANRVDSNMVSTWYLLRLLT